MKLSREDLTWAVNEGLLPPGQDRILWDALEKRAGATPRFDAAHAAYYAGALIVIGAMGWFMTTAWEIFGGGGIMAIALVYAGCFTLLGRLLWDRLGLRVPGGLLFTMAVSMTPLATYGFLRLCDLWPQGDPGAYAGFHVWVKGSWVTLEIATVLVGLLVVRLRPFPFLTAPIGVALWYFSMDIGPLLIGVPDFDWAVRRWVSVWFGLAMLVGAYAVDLRGKSEDFAFWTHLFGLLAFWGGLSLMNSDSELGKFLYALINVGLIAMSVVLRRRAYMIFGALGVSGYIGHLAHQIFQDSLLFPVALSGLGLGVIALGVVYQRNSAKIEAIALGVVPPAWRRLIPPRARG